jgi:hypothetical protein
MIGGLSARHGLIALWCFVAVGCAQVTTGPPEEAIQAAEPAAAAATPLAADEPAKPEPPSSVPVANISDITENSIHDAPVATDPAPSTVSVGDIALEASEPVVTLEASTVQEFEPAPAPIPYPVASPLVAETLDFSSLVTRLRKTKAISLRTKVAVKNESDDLLEQFRVYHTQHGITTLADLRRSYDLLFDKLRSLLEDADPPLARDIDRSQAAIWELLADPRKFSASDLMAGA